MARIERYNIAVLTVIETLRATAHCLVFFEDLSIMPLSLTIL